MRGKELHFIKVQVLSEQLIAANYLLNYLHLMPVLFLEIDDLIVISSFKLVLLANLTVSLYFKSLLSY